jgi:hypothetical protein
MRTSHDPLHLVEHAQAHRKPRIEPAAELADEPRPQHELVAGKLGFLGGFLEGGEEELAGAHELSAVWPVEPAIFWNQIIGLRIGILHPGAAFPALAGARDL